MVIRAPVPARAVTTVALIPNAPPVIRVDFPLRLMVSKRVLKTIACVLGINALAAAGTDEVMIKWPMRFSRSGVNP